MGSLYPGLVDSGRTVIPWASPPSRALAGREKPGLFSGRKGRNETPHEVFCSQVLGRGCSQVWRGFGSRSLLSSNIPPSKCNTIGCFSEECICKLKMFTHQVFLATGVRNPSPLTTVGSKRKALTAVLFPPNTLFEVTSSRGLRVSGPSVCL